MPKRTIKFTPNKKCHIYNRKKNKTLLFKLNQDTNKFKKSIKKYSVKYGVKIHGYAIMDNHFHILASPYKKDSFEKFLGNLQKVYALYFNHKYKQNGQVFESRHNHLLQKFEEIYFNQSHRPDFINICK